MSNFQFQPKWLTMSEACVNQIMTPVTVHVSINKLSIQRKVTKK